MKWEWMLLSFIPGILAQVFRGLRWKQTLDPIGERPSRRVCINAIFLSYAVSLVIPRSGELFRCGVLAKHEKISFPKALGTVITERIVDTVFLIILIAIVFLTQIPVFLNFFTKTGVSIEQILSNFTQTGIYVTLVCLFCAIFLAYLMLKQLTFMRRIKSAVHGIMQGLLSLKYIQHPTLYILYSLGIWVAYFFHYYLTFFCFSSTADLGPAAAIVSFCVGTIAVIVPTPNGAGPWHFAVKTILVIYGLSAVQAITFALIVHSVQTLLLAVLGIYGAVSSALTPRVLKQISNTNIKNHPS